MVQYELGLTIKSYRPLLPTQPHQYLITMKESSNTKVQTRLRGLIRSSQGMVLDLFLASPGPDREFEIGTPP